jgi:hypothetical protein
MNVYVLLEWFYEGDSDLVDSFVSVFSSYEKALSKMNKINNTGIKLLTKDEIEYEKKRRTRGYGDLGFFEIRECKI